MGKPGVMLYFELRPCLEKLTVQEKAEMLDALMDYGEYGQVPELSDRTSLIWPLVQLKLDRDTKRYGETVLRNQYANYTKSIGPKENRLSYPAWKEQRAFSELPPEPSGAQWAPVEPTGAQTTNYIPQTTDYKPQTPNPKPQTGLLEPSATPPSFSPPAREAVLAYCQEQGYLTDVDSFLDYYTANGWKVGKAPMKNWQAALRRWCRKEETNGKTADGPTWSIGTKI